MKRILQFIRSNEWWEYKLPPLLAIGYATAMNSGMPVIRAAPHLLLLLLGIFIGAVYVSTINDITDVKEDALCGKDNRMAHVPSSRRWIVPSCCLVAGLIFERLLYPDRLSMVLYALPWVAFSLYSFPPFRLKQRGFWGVLADAGGSHLFISLLMVSSTTHFARAARFAGASHFAGAAPDATWLTLIGVWSLLYGLRGILFHQFLDRENDIRSGLTTYATQIPPSVFRKRAFSILLAEMLTLGCIIWKIHSLLPALALVVYAIVALVRQKFFGYTLINILTSRKESFQIWMGEYYQVFFPLSLLLQAAIVQRLGWVVLIIHCLLFPKTIWLYGKEAKDLVYRRVRA